MKKTQQGAAIAICSIGILLGMIGAGVLISELRKERAWQKVLEEEAVRLRKEIESLKTIGARSRTILLNFEPMNPAGDYRVVDTRSPGGGS